MNALSKLIPTPFEIAREGIIVFGGLLLAAYILSKFPKLQTFVQSNSITVKDNSGNILF